MITQSIDLIAGIASPHAAAVLGLIVVLVLGVWDGRPRPVLPVKRRPPEPEPAPPAGMRQTRSPRPRRLLRIPPLVEYPPAPFPSGRVHPQPIRWPEPTARF